MRTFHVFEPLKAHTCEQNISFIRLVRNAEYPHQEE